MNKSKDPKTRMLRIRLSDTEYDLLKEKSEKTNKTMSDFIRDFITKGKVTKCRKENLSSLILHLSLIGNNINQIAKNLNIANKQGNLSEQDYDLLLDELMQINLNLKALLDDY